MRSNKFLLVIFMLCLFLLEMSPLPSVRIKDVAYFKGIRSNQLMGVGLVTGLAGKGDSPGSPLLQKVLSNLLSHFDINLNPEDLKSKNCAVVVVTADIPPFIRPGDNLDMTISSIGDAKSLESGILLQTSLKAANNNIYAVGQGKVIMAANKESSQTVGYIPGGGIVEKEVISRFIENNTIQIILRNPDFVTSASVTDAIKKKFPDITVSSLDPALIEITIPEDKKNDAVRFMADIESLTITPDVSGKIVINRESDIIIVGENVKIGKVAVSYKQVSANVGAFGNQDSNPDTFFMKESAGAEDFVNVLKSVGLKTDVIIGILQSIEKAGALLGDLVIM